MSSFRIHCTGCKDSDRFELSFHLSLKQAPLFCRLDNAGTPAVDTMVFASESTLLCGEDAEERTPAMVSLWDVEQQKRLATLPAHDKVRVTRESNFMGRCLFRSQGVDVLQSGVGVIES
jgi:hypothetical protein